MRRYSNPLSSRGRGRSVSGALAAAIALAVGSAAGLSSSAAGQSIEGVWSFNGGQVAIHPAAGGTFTGTVVAPTLFAECSHAIGEAMWTQMRLQPDGSYWGLHQWFFEKAACALNPQLGPTAWRVMSTSGGAHFLRACFSQPGTTQPTIAANGESADVTYGCANSALVAPPPSGSVLSSDVVLPSASRCTSRRLFQIHLNEPPHDPIREVLVSLKGRSLKVKRRGNVLESTINLRGLPKGIFTVRIAVTTVLGHHYRVKRTYHTCVPGHGSSSHGR